MRAGIVAEIVGIAALGLVISPTTPWYAVVPCLFVYGFGVGLATAQLTGVVLVDVPVQRSGEGSGLQSTSRQIGSALGIAILGTVLFTTAAVSLDNSLDDLGVPEAARTGIVNAVVDSAGGAIPGLSTDPRTAAAAPVAAAGLLRCDEVCRVHRCRLPRPRPAGHPFARRPAPGSSHAGYAARSGRRRAPAAA